MLIFGSFAVIKCTIATFYVTYDYYYLGKFIGLSIQYNCVVNANLSFIKLRSLKFVCIHPLESNTLDDYNFEFSTQMREEKGLFLQ